MTRDALRARLLSELALLVALTGLVLTIPRPPWVNFALAGLGLALLLANRGFTRVRVWASFPVEVERPRQGWLAAALFTGAGIGLLAGITAAQGQAERLSSPPPLRVIGVYAAWALLQQYLFQFYLLGRLLVLLPRPLAVCGTGVAFAAVHFPDAVVMAATGPAGCIWALFYLRYRLLVPLAISHAVLGAALFQWVYGRDLLAHWTHLTAWAP